jgi:hypothetical protein
MTFWSSPSSALPKHLILFPPAQELSRRARCADRASVRDSFEIDHRYFLLMIAMPFTSFGSVVPHPFPSRTSFGLSRYHRLEPCRGPSNCLHQPELILTGHVRGPLQRHPRPQTQVWGSVSPGRGPLPWFSPEAWHLVPCMFNVKV